VSHGEIDPGKVETYVGPRPFRAVVGDDLGGRPRVRVRVLEVRLRRGRA